MTGEGNPSLSDRPLHGRVIAIPETRQMEVLASLLENRGADVLRCPLVAIRDASDPAPIMAWIDRLAGDPPEILILYTGEGIRRLKSFAERSGRLASFIAALGRTRTLCRGPKPKKALKDLGLAGAIDAAQPTTAGIVTTLGSLPVDGRRVAVQLFSDTPPPELAQYLDRRGATVDYVSPYVYASAADDARVVDLIRALDAGTVDAIAFTSQSQVERLFRVADKAGLRDALDAGLAKTRIAAVGPVVAAELRDAGLAVAAEPDRSFSMKPLVSKICELFAS